MPRKSKKIKVKANTTKALDSNYNLTALVLKKLYKCCNITSYTLLYKDKLRESQQNRSKNIRKRTAVIVKDSQQNKDSIMLLDKATKVLNFNSVKPKALDSRDNSSPIPNSS